jgi:hypothetical protein
MKSFFSFALFLCLQVLSFAQPEGFTSLFNGKNLQGWWGLDTVNPESWINLPEEDLAQKRANSLTDIQKHWRVENQELVNDGKGLYLTTIQNFSDFELQLEYKTVPLADSGIYLRGYPQVQIWDTTEAGGKWRFGAEKGSGGLWNNRPGDGWQPLVHADKPFGEWNHFRIIMKDDRVTIYLNQQLVVEDAVLINYWHKKTKKPILSEGPIQLQTHGGEIRWRNLYLKELS